MSTTVLISGASVAGPITAFWLRRLGFTPTVVERTPQPRLGLGGHAVDLFAGAVDVIERMGVLARVEAARTRTDTVEVVRPGRRPVVVPMATITSGLTTGRHLEVMRGELARILHESVRDDVEHLFGDEVVALDDGPDGVDVTFARAAPRRFDLVIGADGMHSGIRGLVFGAERDFRHDLGGHLAAFTLPGADLHPGRMVTLPQVDRTVGLYPVRQTGEARALFLFRDPTDHDRHDTAAQKRLLRRVFGADGWEVPRLLAAMEDAPDFYLDSISQIRMPSWSRGRVTLVGDAGYCSGPAVGGGTSIAAVGAYLLAHHLAAADGDHTLAYPAYERAMEPIVRGARQIGPEVMRTIVPRTRVEAALFGPALRVLAALPSPVVRRVVARGSATARVLDGLVLPEMAVSSG
jgi:2-polyprenyl-6-methoxyphenol hydroxylase-like FAD-dependent oxidoreductase